MLYKIKCSGPDPFDLMCSDCSEHEIEWWEDITLEKLRDTHDEQVMMDKATPDWMIQEMQEQGIWNPTNPNFEAWLEQSIVEGYIEVAT